MASKASKKKKVTDSGIIVVKKMRDYSKDPVVQKRAEEAIAFLKKHPLPDSFTKNKL